MAWIEAHQSLRNHPKLGRLARRLHVPKAQAAGHLIFLWYWVTDYAEDGDISEFESQELADAADWTEDADVFVLALIDTGFIDADTEGNAASIHDWQQYGGKLADRKKQNAERQKRYREQHAKRDDDSTPSSRIDNVTRTSPSRNGATVQDSTVQDSTVTHTRVPIAHAREEPPETARVWVYESEFAGFLSAYPSNGHASKVKTKAAYAAARERGATAEAIAAGVAKWSASGRWQRGYVQNAAEWLNDGNYAKPAPRDPTPKGPKNDNPRPHPMFTEGT